MVTPAFLRASSFSNLAMNCVTLSSWADVAHATAQGRMQQHCVGEAVSDA